MTDENGPIFYKFRPNILPREAHQSGTFQLPVINNLPIECKLWGEHNTILTRCRVLNRRMTLDLSRFAVYQDRWKVNLTLRSSTTSWTDLGGMTVELHVFCVTSVLVWTSAVSIALYSLYLATNVPDTDWMGCWVSPTFDVNTKVGKREVPAHDENRIPGVQPTASQFTHWTKICLFVFPKPGYFVLFAPFLT
jgi:hypothetical protein